MSAVVVAAARAAARQAVAASLPAAAQQQDDDEVVILDSDNENQDTQVCGRVKSSTLYSASLGDEDPALRITAQHCRPTLLPRLHRLPFPPSI